MESAPFASRLAQRLRWPIAVIGGMSAALAAADLLGWVSDNLTIYAAAAVALPAVLMFLCAVFDMRLQRAISALNADLRAEARRRGWFSRLTGAGVAAGDRILLAVGLPLMAVTFFASNVSHHGPAAALSFAGFFLVCISQIALTARGYPTERWAPFS